VKVVRLLSKSKIGVLQYYFDASIVVNLFVSSSPCKVLL